MTNIIAVLCMITVSIAATFCAPEFFGKNRFLDGFITYELLGILAIIMTVTLASIANIHLALNRIIRTAFKDKVKGAAHANVVRREINQNGWALVVLFVVACVLLFVKGWPPSENIYVLSFVHSMGIVLLFTNILILCDIYQVIFAVVRLEGRTLTPSSGEGQTF
jgi:hypothetical protein